MKAKLKNNRLLLAAVFFCALAALMFWPTGVKAEGETGDFTVTGTGSYTYENGVLTVNSGAVDIHNTDLSKATSHTIVVKGSASITLSGVNISVGDASALKLEGENTNLDLTLSGTNTLKSGVSVSNFSFYKACFNVPDKTSVTIGGTGSLSATSTDAHYIHGAGIGGNDQENAGNVTINSGIVKASCQGYSGAYAAGIGGGRNGKGGAVTINGGTVEAVCSGNGDSAGAGIGGGENGNGGDVVINGGSVKAMATASDYQGENIGHGAKHPNFPTPLNSGTLQNGLKADVSLVTLTAQDTDPSAVSGEFVDHLTVGNYTGAADPDATNKVYGIRDMQTDSAGGLYLYLPGNAIDDIHNAAELWFREPELQTWYSGTVDSPTRTATLAAFDGSIDLAAAGGNLYIWDKEYGIGSTSGGATKKPYTGSYTLTGTTTTNTVNVMDDYKGGNPAEGGKTITLNDLNINVSGQSGTSAFDIEAGASVNLMLASESQNTLQSSGYRAGLRVPVDAALTIDSAAGTGSITATGGNQGAGIGGGSAQAGGEVAISGGRITATGGAGAAGIGGGNGGDGGAVIISGGSVTATGGQTTGGIASGAGIGGGAGKAGKAVTITGGSVEATGGYNGAGIGGGYQGAGGAITIEGGSVEATGGSSGAGIGTGSQYTGINSDTVTIRGGTVTATGGGYSGAGIGGGLQASGATVIIDGGSVNAVAGKYAEKIGNGEDGEKPGTLTNTSGDPVYLNTLTVGEGGQNPEISVEGEVSIDTNYPYGTKDVTTMNGGKLYFYLPAKADAPDITVTHGTTTYSRNYPRVMEKAYTATLLPPASYTITIPENVSFQNPTYKPKIEGQYSKYCIDTTFTVAPTELINLTDDRSLTVMVSDGGGGADTNYKLTDPSSRQTLNYQVYKEDPDYGEPLAASGEPLVTDWQRAESEDPPAAKQGTLRLDQSQILYSGNYEGTLTFTVNINDIAPSVSQ